MEEISFFFFFFFSFLKICDMCAFWKQNSQNKDGFHYETDWSHSWMGQKMHFYQIVENSWVVCACEAVAEAESESIHSQKLNLKAQ